MACVDSAVVGGTPDGSGSGGSLATSAAGSTSAGSTSTGLAASDSSDSGDESTSTGGSDTDVGTTDSTGADEAACDLEALALAYSDSIADTPVECGDVHFKDPADDWVATHDCIVEQQAETNPFVAFYQLGGIDGNPRFAALGLDGGGFPRLQLAELPSGFIGVPIPIHLRECSSFVVDPNCTPTSGTLCIECEIVSSEQICP